MCSCGYTCYALSLTCALVMLKSQSSVCVHVLAYLCSDSHRTNDRPMALLLHCTVLILMSVEHASCRPSPELMHHLVPVTDRTETVQHKCTGALRAWVLAGIRARQRMVPWMPEHHGDTWQVTTLRAHHRVAPGLVPPCPASPNARSRCCLGCNIVGRRSCVVLSMLSRTLATCCCIFVSVACLHPHQLGVASNP